MRSVEPERRVRIIAAIVAATVQGALLYGLILGLGVTMPVAIPESLKTFAILPASPPPVRIVPPRISDKRPEGVAAPPNLRSRASEIVAPVPVVPPPAPPPIIVATIAETGSDPSSGASDRAGPGTGSGGIGTGTGSGGRGNGDGGGDESPPWLKKGRIKDSDYPRGAGEAGISGTVTTRYRVGIDGRVTKCVITRSSGSPLLDETTCRLIEQRFRYEPSRDALGRPVVSYIVRNNDWIIERDPTPTGRQTPAP